MGLINFITKMADWKTGLFGCHENIGTCCFGLCCPACLYGKTSEVVEGDCMMAAVKVLCCGPCTVCCWAPQRRQEIITMYALNSGSCVDSGCITWCCCGNCANCQENNQLTMNNMNSNRNGSLQSPHRAPELRPASQLKQTTFCFRLCTCRCINRCQYRPCMLLLQSGPLTHEHCSFVKPPRW